MADCRASIIYNEKGMERKKKEKRKKMKPRTTTQNVAARYKMIKQ